MSEAWREFVLTVVRELRVDRLVGWLARRLR